ncbi:hypothetical protein [Streptomyces sp. NPDC047014]|uniref:hypothetical protein n=1 Tax=Streptomyces sp. NPDC047014 TaxID=3155736 RepID=UPI003406AB6D
MSVDVLAGVLVDLALMGGVGVRGVLHAGHPVPVGARELVEVVCGGLGLPLPVGEVGVEDALRRLEAGGVPAGVVRRQLDLLTVDHFFNSDRLWGVVGTSPGPVFGEAFGEFAGWYREYLGL